jgi:hypothetical protein
MKEPEKKKLEAMPGLLAGFSRTFLTKSILFGLSLLREGIQWWFRIPIKMFRPYAVNPWLVLNEMAAIDGQRFTVGYIRKVVEKDGWRMLGLNVVPLMVANGMVGVVLFHSYTLASIKTRNDFVAGGIAGMTSTFMATPMDRLTQMMTREKVMKHRHRGVHRALHSAFDSLPSNSISKATFLYRGFAFNLFKLY